MSLQFQGCVSRPLPLFMSYTSYLWDFFTIFSRYNMLIFYEKLFIFDQNNVKCLLYHEKFREIDSNGEQ